MKLILLVVVFASGRGQTRQRQNLALIAPTIPLRTRIRPVPLRVGEIIDRSLGFAFRKMLVRETTAHDVVFLAEVQVVLCGEGF